MTSITDMIEAEAAAAELTGPLRELDNLDPGDDATDQRKSVLVHAIAGVLATLVHSDSAHRELAAILAPEWEKGRMLALLDILHPCTLHWRLVLKVLSERGLMPVFTGSGGVVGVLPIWKAPNGGTQCSPGSCGDSWAQFIRDNAHFFACAECGHIIARMELV